MRFVIKPKRLKKEEKGAYLIVVSSIFGGVLSNLFIKIPEWGFKGVFLFFMMVILIYYFLKEAIKFNS